MRTHFLTLALATASLVSCTGIPPATQAKLDQAQAEYETATGITAQQTGGLLFKLYQDYQLTKATNALLKTNVIQATKASLVTSTKQVLDVLPTSAFVPSDPPSPAPELPEQPPAKPERPSPRDPPQLLASH